MGAGAHRYPYTHHLLQLEQCQNPGYMPEDLRRVESPRVLSQWSALLKGHPDSQFVHYVLTGIRDGFRVGFNYAQVVRHPAKSNLFSADSKPVVAARYLAEEVALGRIIGLSHQRSS